MTTNCTCPHRFGAPYHDDECPAVKQRSYTTATHAMTTDHEPECNCNASVIPAFGHDRDCPAHPANAEAVATETRRFKVRSLCQASKEASDLPNDWNQVVQANVAHRLQRDLAEAERELEEIKNENAKLRSSQKEEWLSKREAWHERDDLRAQLTAANLQISVMGQNYEAELQAMRDKLGAFKDT